MKPHYNIFKGTNQQSQQNLHNPHQHLQQPIVKYHLPIQFPRPNPSPHYQQFIPELKKQPQTLNLQKSQTTKNRNKIKVSSIIEQENDAQNLLDLNLITQAVNNSYMKRLSGNENCFKTNEIVELLTEHSLKNLLKTQIKKGATDKKNKQWNQYDYTPFFIVEIDESSFEEVSKTGSRLFGCGDVKNHNQGDQPYDEIIQNLQLYSLVMELGGNQLHFQSFDKKGKSINLNMDTVALSINQKFIERSKPNEKWKYPIIIHTLTKPSLQIFLYITARTLPFPMSQQPLHQNIPYLIKMHSKLANFLSISFQGSRGRNMHLEKIQSIILQNQYKFFQRRYATQEQFQRYCETGDILLFRGKHFFGKMQRFLTNSYYDHVGIVYKSQQYGICLFQSNSGMGVAMAIWRQLLRYKWYEGLEKITWRKLRNNNKSLDLDKKVGQFIKGNLNKQFKLNLAKLLKFRSTIGSTDGSQKKNYFCSQLIATLYKHLGFLQHGKSSTQYWPKDFSDGEGLQMINGALDAERQLIFEDQIIHHRYPHIK